MIARAFRWTAGIVIGASLAMLLFLTWLIATESGARWLLGQASSRLPEALSIESVDGTLLKGLQFYNIAWLDPSATASMAELAIHVELMPLLKREVLITTLAIRNAEVTTQEGPEPEGPSEPLSV